MPHRAEGSILLAGTPVGSLHDYIAAGGGRALEKATSIGPEAVIDEITRSGLRGRGGAGFPTGAKWRAVRSSPELTKYFVCNAAEGEPGTFKDRNLMSANPYQLLEGIAIAAFAVGAEEAYVALKSAFAPQIEVLQHAYVEMIERDMLGLIPIKLAFGPDEYLFGEEKAMMEVIEGHLPLPRILPPYQDGLFSSQELSNPTAVNNVETLANVPHIVRNGAAWFRSFGTDSSPGTMVFTVSGDVQAPGVYELPLGITLGELVNGVAGGPADGRAIKAIIPGASSTIITAGQLDVPLDFDAMREAGTGLGSAGFVVYDESACMLQAAHQYLRFLYVESCGQCPPCKLSSGEIVSCLERLEAGVGTEGDLLTILERAPKAVEGQRCALPNGISLLAQSAVLMFREEFESHIGRPCPRPRPLPFPKFLDYDEQAGRFVYDERYRLKRPDWSYADGESAAS